MVLDVILVLDRGGEGRGGLGLLGLGRVFVVGIGEVDDLGGFEPVVVGVVRRARGRHQGLGESGRQVVGERRRGVVVGALHDGVLGGRRVLRRARLPLGEGGVQVLVVGPVGDGRAPIVGGGFVLDVGLVLRVVWALRGRRVAVDGAEEVREVRHV